MDWWFQLPGWNQRVWRQHTTNHEFLFVPNKPFTGSLVVQSLMFLCWSVMAATQIRSLTARQNASDVTDWVLPQFLYVICLNFPVMCDSWLRLSPHFAGLRLGLRLAFWDLDFDFKLESLGLGLELEGWRLKHNEASVRFLHVPWCDVTYYKSIVSVYFQVGLTKLHRWPRLVNGCELVLWNYDAQLAIRMLARRKGYYCQYF